MHNERQRTSDARTPEPTRMSSRSMILRFAEAGRSHIDRCTTKLALPVATCCAPILLHDNRHKSKEDALGIVSGEHILTLVFSSRRCGRRSTSTAKQASISMDNLITIMIPTSSTLLKEQRSPMVYVSRIRVVHVSLHHALHRATSEPGSHDSSLNEVSTKCPHIVRDFNAAPPRPRIISTAQVTRHFS